MSERGRTPGSKPARGVSVTTSPASLTNVGSFKASRLVRPFRERYERDATLADYARGRLVTDLRALNDRYFEQHGRVILTAVEGRVKEEDSYLRKLHRLCQELARARGFSAATVEEARGDTKDLCGVRFSCPYYDEVVPTLNGVVRPGLADAGYATDLQADPRLADRDVLDQGDRHGYRSYHFFLRVPTPVDIFGNEEMCLCEVQARTELQHVWADKSHDLLYKPKGSWDFSDPHVVEDMRQVSNHLRAVDQLLVSIRDRAQGGGKR